MTNVSRLGSSTSYGQANYLQDSTKQPSQPVSGPVSKVAALAELACPWLAISVNLSSTHSVNFLPMMIVFMSYDKLQASLCMSYVYCSRET